MATVLNSFDGGVNTTTITAVNSGGASGAAFDSVTVGSGGTLAYDNTQAAHGSLSAKVAFTSGQGVFFYWRASIPASQPTYWWRAYVYVTGNPGGNLRVVNVTAAASAMSAFMNASGNISVTYGSGGTSFVTFAAAVPLSAWFRLEGFVTLSATVGQVSCAQYNSMDSATPTETHTSTANLNTGTPGTTTVQYADSNSAAFAFGPMWLDDVGASTDGPLGPFASAALSGGEATYVPALIAAGAI